MPQYIKPNGHRSNYEVVNVNGINVSVDASESHILAEKYRPRILDDLILPKGLKSKVKEIIETQTIPNMLFFSTTGGTGKDSIISVIKAQVPLTMLTINASSDRSIETVRTKIMQFVQTPSMDGTRKVCYLTEAGGMTPVAIDSLKALIEDYSNRVSFLMTTNSLSNLTQPFMSRFQYVDLNILPKDERQSLGMETFKRVCAILTNEQIAFQSEDVGKLLVRFFPSYRELMNAIGLSVVNGNLVVNESLSKNVLNDVIKFINAEDYESIVRISESINVPSFAQEMNRLHYVGLLADSKAFVGFIPALNELQQSISKAVPFLNISFCLFCYNLMKSKIKLLEQ